LYRFALGLSSLPGTVAKTLSLLSASALMGFLMLKIALANAG
jgi:hypothetical protein